MVREITEYEHERWYDEYGRFEMGEDAFLSYGDELGEAFQAALDCTTKEDYGLSAWFVKAAQVQCLDMYYDQVLLYTNEYGIGDDPEDLGLASREEFQAKAKELGIEGLSYFGESRDDGQRKLWDWAMDWRDDPANQEAFEIRMDEKQIAHEQRLLDLRRQTLEKGS